MSDNLDIKTLRTNLHPTSGRKKLWQAFRSQYILQIFVLMGMAFFLVFSYIPMIGIIIGFKDYRITMGLPGFFTADWVGLKWFLEFYNDIYFWRIIRNTILMSILKLIFTFPIPIIFALTLNEIRNHKLKRITQTVSYLPHFVSWVVVTGILFSFLNLQNGLFNQVLKILGRDPVSFLSTPKYFLPMIVISDIWKGFGWWAIIFLAAIAGVDQEMYESALIDGASRMQRIAYITLPSIRGTIIIVLILSIGNLFGGGLGGSNFDQAYLLGNAVNRSRSEILQTYTLTMGLAQGRYSYATAIGFFQSLISLFLIYTSNFISKKMSGYGLF